MTVATALSQLQKLFAEYSEMVETAERAKKEAERSEGEPGAPTWGGKEIGEALNRMQTWHQQLGECFGGLVEMANDGHSDFSLIEGELDRFTETASARFGGTFIGPKIPFGLLGSLYILRSDLRFAVANHGRDDDCTCSVLIDNALITRGPETTSLDVVGKCDEQFDHYIDYKCKACQRRWRLHDTSDMHGHSQRWELL